MNLEVLNTEGKKVEELKLLDKIFGAKPNQALVHSALLYYLSSRQQGTHSAKTRTEVSGGGKKPWKQKGTGRARAGSSRSPLWRHGGVIFPPKTRSHAIDLPRKMRRSALANVISSKASEGRIKIISEIKLSAAKTREFLKFLSGLNLTGQKVLMVIDKADNDLMRASRNIESFKMVDILGLNIFDLLNSEVLVLTKDSALKLTEVLQ